MDRAAATAAHSAGLLFAQTLKGGPPGRAGARGIHFGSWRPSDVEQVSGMKTIGASSPLAAWTVITRTLFASASMSRLMDMSAFESSSRKA